MDQQTLARALDPLFTTKGRGKGTGLGLPVVQTFVSNAGGRLLLDSELAKGTTAEIWLPLFDRADAAPTLSVMAAPAPVSQTRRLSILAVDDDPLVLLNTSRLLADLGHQVTSTESPLDALNIIRDTPALDLVVTDFAMPGMTGHQLRLAANKVRPELRFVMATGYINAENDPDDRCALLDKPFTEHQLANAIERAVNSVAELRHAWS